MANVAVVDPKEGALGEWMFAPSESALGEASDRPLADGLIMLADRVLPLFEKTSLFAVAAVALRPIGGPDAVYPSLLATIEAVDKKETALPRSEASIEVVCNVQVVSTTTGELLLIEHGALIAWRWIGEPVIQVKIYCDAFVREQLDRLPNPIAPPNQHRLAVALSALQAELGATVELGDDQMPWTRAEGFYLSRK